MNNSYIYYPCKEREEEEDCHIVNGLRQEGAED